MGLPKLTIIKIGGNVIDNSEKLHHFLKDFSALEGLKILVHGGGKIASELGLSMGITPNMVEGRRITDIETLRVVAMVYAGLINKNLVAQLQNFQCNAIGLSGADGNSIKTVKRAVKDGLDYGYVGDITSDSINVSAISNLLSASFIPVFSAITHDGNGQILNTNADTIASSLAQSLAKLYAVDLVYCFEKKGVLSNLNDPESVITLINPISFETLKQDGIVADGMIPKIKNALDAVEKGVSAVFITCAEDLSNFNHKKTGTKITL